MNTMLYTQC